MFELPLRYMRGTPLQALRNTGVASCTQDFNQHWPKLVFLVPLAGRLPIATSDFHETRHDIQVKKAIHFQRPSRGRYFGCSSQITSVAISDDLRGGKTFLGSFHRTKFAPDKNFEVWASSSLELAFHSVLDELSTLSRSKIKAALAKSSRV